MVLIWWFVRDFFIFIYTFLQTIIQWLSGFIWAISSSVGFLFKIVNVLPTAFTVSFIALVGIAVLYKIFGREGQD